MAENNDNANNADSADEGEKIQENYKFLVARRGIVKAQLTRFDTFLKKCTPVVLQQKTSVIDLQTRLENMKNSIIDFEHVQGQIERLCLNFNLAEINQQDDERDEFETKYYDLFARAKLTLDQVPKDLPLAPSNTNSPPVSFGVQSGPRLPPIPLPQFSGSYETWVNFRDTFDSLIDKNCYLENVEKFYYLQSSLKGEAAQIISSLATTDNSYLTAWSLLRDRYENKKAIAHTHVKGIFEINPVKDESHQSLRKFLDSFQRHYKSLDNLGENVADWSTILLYLLTSKLDLSTRKEWENCSKDKSHPSTQDFISFLSERCRFLESLDFKLNPKKYERKIDKSIEQKTLIHFSQTNSCPLCKEGHVIYACKQFIDFPVHRRFSEAKQANLCTNCLRPGHRNLDCKSFHTCRICRGKHHTLLHIQRNIQSPLNKPAGNNQSNTIAGLNSTVNPTSLPNPQNPQINSLDPQTNHSNNACMSCTNQNPANSVLLSTALINVFNQNRELILCRAILDNGSQSNFITQDLLDKLNIPSESINVPIFGINQKTTNISKRVKLEIKSIHKNFTFKIPALVIDKITDFVPQQPLNCHNLNIPNDLSLADDEFYKPAPIDVLLGAELFYEIIGSNQIKLGKNKPILQETKFGWVVGGPVTFLTTVNPPSYFSFTCTTDVQSSLERFWSLEEPPETKSKSYSNEELECEAHFQSNTIRDSHGRFQVSLPLKLNVNTLGDSFDISSKRFYAIERKLNKNPILKEHYSKFMTEYADLGHMTEIDPNLNLASKYPINYLPHHSVEKQDSLTTRLRVVFDGSAPTSSGISINDTLMVGPTIQNDIFSILIRFRQHNFVLTGDIAKMYRQVLINPEQRNLQRILWRDDSSKRLQHYCLNTITYGLSCSAYLATRCLKQISLNHQIDFPVESRIISLDCYVDDILTGASSEEKLITIRKNLTSIFKSYGFDLRKFNSNEPKVLSDLTSNNKNCMDYVITDSQNTKTLGISWNSLSDLFIYYSNIKPSSSIITKRIILSAISKIFDPLGLLGPMIIQIKILLQKLWLQKIDWDAPIPPELYKIWINFEKHVDLVDCFNIPRQITLKNPIRQEIHGFCDASNNAYGACIYIRSINPEGDISCNLLCAKSRVAPLKAISLPRLELCGALILSKLMKRVLETLDIRFDKIFYYTDSTIVLCWLSLEPRQLKTFVCNRISEIQEISNTENWYHVASSNNPADIISRGITPDNLKNCNLWWHGSSYLSENAEDWPNDKHISNFSRKYSNSEIPEFNSKTITLITSETCSIFEKYSSYTKLINVVAYCLRFVANAKSSNARKSGSLTPEERNLSLILLVKLLQQECFSDELQTLTANKPIRLNSKLSSLNPFIDEHSIIRVGGRLRHANIDFNSKHPIVLPSKHPFTKLIITDIHTRNLHPGTQATLSFVRQHFWPLNGKNNVRSIIRKCIPCFKANPKSLSNIMGDLPRQRVTPSRPFLNVGIDYAGPFLLRDSKFRNRRILKCYICIFICLATKAIHLELASELTTECFICAFRRFVSRRGLCQDVYSDNGSNFVGAKNVLQDIYDTLKSDSFQLYINDQNIKWHFIPSRSPHFGGIWEGAVKSVKHHLRRVLNENPLNYEEFYTLLVQVEAILNSRPLIPLSNDPNDLEILTPGHFIMGHPVNMVPDRELQHEKVNRLTRYQHLQHMFQSFWSRWSSEYLHTLHQRSKWKFQTNHENLIGCLVLLKEDNIPPCRWPRGRISSVHPGSDNVVRVVNVTTPKGTVRRSIVKVCLLPVDDNFDN